MKFLIITLFVAVFSTVQSQDQRVQVDLVSQAEEACGKEKNVSSAQIALVEAGDFSQADLDKLSCLSECVFYKLEFMKLGSFNVNIEAMKKVYQEKGGERFGEIVEKCSHQTADNACDLSYLIYKCTILENLKPTTPPVVPTNVLKDLFNAGAVPAQQPQQQQQQPQQTQQQLVH